jgi:hypothetical protein
MIPTGFIVSIIDNGGLRTINQLLEVGIVVGFLAGTWLLARKKPVGYLWLVFMNLSCGCLMYRQAKMFMVAQQVLSVLFVLGAYYNSGRKRLSEN